MPSKNVMKTLLTTLAVVVTLVTTVVPLSASDTEHVLHAFSAGRDGAVPVASLIFDAAGNLYGTTQYGGVYSSGTVFKLVPNTNGTWTETVLHSFNGKDGAQPYAGLVFDTSGNLYGTTAYGGNSTTCTGGCGTVFELRPLRNGNWGHKVLHTFGGHGGAIPMAPLILDRLGNLYGTTIAGGTYNLGTVFELSPGSNGKWTKTVLHTFGPDGYAGYSPDAPLVFDQSGNLYGTTVSGGRGGVGTVFELYQNGGKWTLKLLHAFDFGREGGESESGVIFDGKGNIYGLALNGAGADYGSAFEMMPVGNGQWNFAVLHQFSWGNDGAYPIGNLVLDQAGNLYGITNDGGGAASLGTVFELIPGSNGHWTETILLSFNTIDAGGFPQAGPILDATGSLYGTASAGGSGGGNGLVFKLTP